VIHRLGVEDSRKGRFIKQREKLSIGLNLATHIRKKRAYTINGGDAIVLFNPAHNSEPAPSPLDRALDAITKRIAESLRIFDAPGQRKRKAEFVAKHEAALEKFLGDAINDMMSVSGLATAPSKQRRGYGSTLVRTVTDIVRPILLTAQANILCSPPAEG